MSDIYSGADAMLGAIKAQRKKVIDASVNAERLPYELTKAFREQGDPKLDKQINAAEQKSLSAGYEGLDKYQNIENPFTRRALASKYQGSVTSEYKNLLSEQERRQGVVSDYIKTWAGTYGAIAKGEQMALEGMKEDYTMQMDLASKRASAAKSSADWKEGDIIQGINEAYASGATWEDISKVLRANRVDVTEGSFADSQLRNIFGEKPYSKTGESGQTPKQQSDNQYYQYINEINGGSSDYKMDENGNILKKNGKGFFGGDKWEMVFQKP